MENNSGRDVRLYPGDLVVCVLGTRNSGTKFSGSFPAISLFKGMELDLLSLGGIVGRASYIPSYMGKTPLTVYIESFPYVDEIVWNLIDINCRPIQLENTVGGIFENTIWIGGTSAECGKTTLVTESIFSLRDLKEFSKVGAIKITGTGRMSDMLRYKDSGAMFVSDYVDEGWPSTYNIPSDKFKEVVVNLLTKSRANSDLSFIEIGGDLLSGGANEVLNFSRQSKYPFFLVVNDAIGAIGAIERLKSAGISQIVVSTMKQNALTLSDWTKYEVLDINEIKEISKKILNILG